MEMGIAHRSNDPIVQRMSHLSDKPTAPKAYFFSENTHTLPGVFLPLYRSVFGLAGKDKVRWPSSDDLRRHGNNIKHVVSIVKLSQFGLV